MIEYRKLTHNKLDVFLIFPNPGCQWQVKMWSFWRAAVLVILKFADISLRAPSFERPAAVSSESSAHKRVVQQRNDPNLQKTIQNMLHPAINKYEKRMLQSHILNHNQNIAANKHVSIFLNLHSNVLRNKHQKHPWKSTPHTYPKRKKTNKNPSALAPTATIFTTWRGTSDMKVRMQRHIAKGTWGVQIFVFLFRFGFQ